MFDPEYNSKQNEDVKNKDIINVLLEEIKSKLKENTNNVTTQTLLNLSYKYITDINNLSIDNDIKKKIKFEIAMITIRYAEIATVVDDNHKLLKHFSRSLKRLAKYSKIQNG